MMVTLIGRVGSILKGYSLKTTWDGQVLQGRIGGRLQGKKLTLNIQGKIIRGKMGSDEISGTFSDHQLEARLDSVYLSHGLEITIGPSTLQGRYSGKRDGKDVRLEVKDAGLTGRIGGKFGGKDVSCTVPEGIPFGLVALALVATYKALEDANRPGII